MRAIWSAVVCLLLVCVLAVQWEQYQAIRTIAERLVMQSTKDLIHTYVSGGVLKTVITTRGETETPQHWKRRHLDEIAESWQSFPPDG